jgi:hypothetical protein
MQTIKSAVVKYVLIYMLPRILVTNNAGSKLDERVYLLLIHTPPVITRNYSARANSALYNSVLHTHTHTHKSSLGNATKTQDLLIVSLNYTHQVLHTKSSIRIRTLATNPYLHFTALHSALVQVQVQVQVQVPLRLTVSQSVHLGRPL